MEKLSTFLAVSLLHTCIIFAQTTSTLDYEKVASLICTQAHAAIEYPSDPVYDEGAKIIMDTTLTHTQQIFTSDTPATTSHTSSLHARAHLLHSFQQLNMRKGLGLSPAEALENLNNAARIYQATMR